MERILNLLALAKKSGSGNGADLLEARVTNSLEAYRNPNISKIINSSFRGCTKLKSIDIPNATHIEQYAFTGCNELTEINFPKAVIVGQHAFQFCTKLGSVNLPVFTGETLNNGNNAPNYLFQECKALKTVSLPQLEKTGTYGMFRDCTSLEEVRTPKNTFAGKDHVYGCTKLRLWDNGFADLNQSGVMNNTSSLETLILRSATVAAITPCSGSVLHTGYTGDIVCNVYVPSALIESYKAATNWTSLFAAGRCVFVALEGSEYE